MEWSQAMNIIIMLMIGAIGWFIRTDKEKTKEELKRNQEDIGELDKRMDVLEKELPFIYVTREDYIRQTAGFDKKLDKVYEAVTGRRPS